MSGGRRRACRLVFVGGGGKKKEWGRRQTAVTAESAPGCCVEREPRPFSLCTAHTPPRPSGLFCHIPLHAALHPMAQPGLAEVEAAAERLYMSQVREGGRGEGRGGDRARLPPSLPTFYLAAPHGPHRSHTRSFTHTTERGGPGPGRGGAGLFSCGRAQHRGVQGTRQRGESAAATATARKKTTTLSGAQPPLPFHPQSLLDATHSPYARLLALSSLLKTVTEAPLE